MRIVGVVARTLMGLSGVIAVTLGILFWTGNALPLLPVHILAGLVLVLSLWTLAALAARAGAPPGLVALAAVWGLLLPLLGLNQHRLLVGRYHWLVQALHLLVGVAAMAQGQLLWARVKHILSLPGQAAGAIASR
jgi:hypothetical protein